MDNAFATSHSLQSALSKQPAARRSPPLMALLAVILLFACFYGWVAGSSPANAGVYYDCPVGMHRFWGCVQSDKPPPSLCPLKAGDPVEILTGRLTEEVVDWSSGGSQPLQLKRSYTSTALTLDASPYSSFGRGWRSNFDARVRMNASSATQADWAHFILPDTFEYNFNKQNGVWQFMAMEWSGSYGSKVSLRATKRTDLDVTLTLEGQQFVLRTPDGVRYVFDAATHAPDAQWRVDGYRTQLLAEVRHAGGYVQKIAYNGDYPSRISDNLGRWIDMQFSAASSRSTLLSQVQTSDGTRIKYAYQDRLPTLTRSSPVDFLALSTVTYPDLTPATDSDNPKRIYQYKDEAGKPGLLLTGMTDERGVRFSTWTYDAKGRALSSEHAGGQDRTQFAYDDVNRVVTVTNPLGRATRYSYRMNAGFVRQLVSIDGIATPGCAASNTRYEYDANGFRSKATDAEGRITTWTRNSRGLPLTERRAVGTPVERLSTMTWDATRPLMLSLAEPGLTTTYTYDAQGRVLTETQTDTTTQTVPYTTRGQRRTTTYSYAAASTANPPAPVPVGPLTVDGPLPGNSDTVRYGYDAAANLISVTNELGQVTRITSYDSGGRPLSVTDPNSVVTTMAYDVRGRLTSVNVNPGAAQARTVIAYDAAGQVTRVTAPDGSYLQYAWNDASRLSSVNNNAGERIDYGYNANGDVISRTVKSASGAIVRQQTWAFDELGRLLRSIGAGGQQTQFYYDRLDRPLQTLNPRGGVSTTFYDALDNVIQQVDPTGAPVTLSRDRMGGLTAYTDPRSLTTRYVRNGFGEIIQESGPDVGTTVFVRDERGLVTRKTDPRGVVTTYSYDAAGRLLRDAHPADAREDVSYTYDATANGNKGIGRLTGITDESGSLARVYDALGRITAETRIISGKTYVIRYAYNAAGRLTSLTYPSGRIVNYTRDGVGRITAVTTRASASAVLETVASGLTWGPMSTRLTGMTHGNGLVTTMGYDQDGRLASLRLVNGTTRLKDLNYAYGDGMNLTGITDNLFPASDWQSSESILFAYDAAQRLVSSIGRWRTNEYGYVATGDRRRELLKPSDGAPKGSRIGSALVYPDESNQLQSLRVWIASPQYAGTVQPKTFSKTGQYEYDPAGNLTSRIISTILRLDFSYNLRNRPVSFTVSGGDTSRYVYNALEQMVSRATTAEGGPKGTVHYIYDLDGSLLAEADGATGATLRDYVWLPLGDASPAADNDNEEGASSPPLPLGVVTDVNTAAPALLIYHADHLGRPVRLTDAARGTVWSAVYDPFGLRLKLTGTVEQNLRFPGQYFLIESDLAYNWHRFYDSATGRYTQPDPLRFVDGPSVYAYAGASPMMRVDPEGAQIRLPVPIGSPIGPGPNPGVKPGPDWKPGLKPMFPTPPRGLIDYVWDGCEWIYRKITVGSGGDGGGDDDGDGRCRVIKETCIEHCTMAIDNVALPDLQSTPFRRCINQCVHDNNCGGNNYSDGWDNGKIGTPKPWKN